MKRRSFLACAGAVATATAFPGLALAQQAAKVPRIAFLSLASPDRVERIREGLADKGYIDGTNIAIELFIPPTTDETRALAMRAVASNPDVILTGTTPATQFAKAFTATIPIVMMGINDPVGNGLIASLGRPGGNVTGNTSTTPDVVRKQLGVLKELLPELRRVALLNLPTDPSAALFLAPLRDAAREFDVDLIVFDFEDTKDLDVQLERVATANVQAFWTGNSAYFGNHDDQLLQFEVRTKIPKVTNNPSLTPFTGVIAYGANRTLLYRQAADYVDAILKGVKPADLPVQAPTLFDLAINTATARAIDVIFPTSILAQTTIVVDEDYRAGR